MSIRPNKLSSDDLSFKDDANMMAVCALFPPMGMLDVVGEYVSIIILASNASFSRVVSLDRSGADPLSCFCRWNVWICSYENEDIR